MDHTPDILGPGPPGLQGRSEALVQLADPTGGRPDRGDPCATADARNDPTDPLKSWDAGTGHVEGDRAHLLPRNSFCDASDATRTRRPERPSQGLGNSINRRLI